MSELRRVRFASIEGLGREDLPLACEIWLDDLFRAPWVTRDAMKLGAYFVRYMADPDPQSMTLSEIERECHLIRDDIHRALKLMQSFTAADAFAIDTDDLRVALNLTILQRVRVLETRWRLNELSTAPAFEPAALPVAEPRWAPEPQSSLDGLDDAALAPLVDLISQHIRRAAQELDAAERAA